MKDKIVTIILSIIIFVVPTLIVPNMWYPYNFLKIIVLLICGLILLITTLLRIDEMKFDKQDILIFIFGFLAILSTIFSVNIRKSVIGESNRYEGLFTIIIYILIYYNAKYYFKNYKRFVDIATVIYILICVFAIIQFYIGYKIKFYPIYGKGSTGTFGNTNFYGSFVSLILPAFILGYIFRKQKVYLLGSIVGFCSMIMCIARSSWVAFILYMIIIAIYLFINKNKNYYKRYAILIITFMICFMVVNVTSKSKFEIVNRKINTMYTELAETIEKGIENKMGSSRIEIWKITSQVALKRPILGCGIDALSDGLRKLCPEENNQFIINHKVYIDKAHNEYLQIASTIGIPALCIYLTFLSIIGLSGIKQIFKYKLVVISYVVIISYLAQAFFNISTIGVAPIFWFTLGMTSRIIKHNKEKEEQRENKKSLTK